MNEVELKRAIESLLFVSEKPLTVKKITEVCPNIENSMIKSALKQLKEEFSGPEKGIHLNEVAGGYQFASNPECVAYLKKLYKTERVYRLSAPALETLAIIAYKQPVTRAEIEFIRGVNVDGVVKTLEDRDLIRIKGRKEVPGRPLLYGTGDEFLHYFGLKSLSDLPSLEEFTAQQLEKIEENAQDQPGDEDHLEDSSEVQDQSPVAEAETADEKDQEAPQIDEDNKLPSDLEVKREDSAADIIDVELDKIELQSETQQVESEVKNGQDEHSETAQSN